MIVRNVPKRLLDDFDRKVVEKSYPGGRAEAIRDYMRKAIQEHKPL
ncbi:MAG: hypothetical protein NWF01_07965 [Candidatus Bathyarchaeota archaeon]|nr:hypothetical protein [Candidatus Bathyarchaeota archaeon]